MSETNDLLREGIAAVKAGERAKGRALLREAVRICPTSVTAWLWLSAAVETVQERRECLDNVLQIDPKNPHATRGLHILDRASPQAAENGGERVPHPEKTEQHVRHDLNKQSKSRTAWGNPIKYLVLIVGVALLAVGLWMYLDAHNKLIPCRTVLGQLMSGVMERTAAHCQALLQRERQGRNLAIAGGVGTILGGVWCLVPKKK
jgi:hypothetical protein